MERDEVMVREIFLSTAEGLLAAGKYSLALRLAQERLDACPDDLDALAVIGRAWLGMGDLANAREAVTQLERAQVSLARLYRDLGDLYLKRGFQAEALSCFHKSMTLLPDPSLAASWSEQLDARIGRLERGRDVGGNEEDEEVGGPAPDFQTLTMAELYIAQGHLETARRVLEAVLAREPGNVQAAARLREVRRLLGGEEEREALIAELSRWLGNIGRIRQA
ncbi:MAG TPA: tetratricopeptide repeat protein [Syntrophales bacterium]|nr:tetratricopeptide repeat protein [Syntrophales bacterium]HOM06337.1 tetratricopeptide repeat protein [Syntrophales bacterium]HON99224.1 tetratricopeptide repeat protein [Syntrophales bacterium]HPC00049.1 tetratricopeptide repeat protein [Syntrophales bacterium]HPQ05682.1 tetratricopeptide repeat protein [Syntrophales bacterium]